MYFRVVCGSAWPSSRGDGEDSFSLPQGDAGMGMPQVVEPDVGQAGLGAHLAPEPFQPARVAGSAGPGRGKHPSAPALQRVENLPGRFRQPDGAGSGLGVAQEDMALAVVRPSQRQDLALPAAGQQEKADDRDTERIPFGMRRQSPGQPADLLVGQEALAPLAAVSPDAPARVGALRPEAHRLGLAHDDREDRHRPVGGDRRRVQGGEPVADLPPVDVGDRAPREMRQELVLEIVLVHFQGTRLPDPLMAFEHGPGDRLEQGLLGSRRRDLVPPNRGQHLRRRATALP